MGILAPAALPGAERILGANDRIRVAIVGNGRRNLLKAVLDVRQAANVDVVAICDTWRQKREEGAARAKEMTGKEPAQYVRYQDVLARKDVDAVIIATPDHAHAAMLFDAARAGKDIYIEKPMAMNMKELTQAVDAVKQNNRLVQVGTQDRSYTYAGGARQFVLSGGLGNILKVENERNAYKPYWMNYGGARFFNLKPQESDVDWKAFLMGRKDRPFDPDQYQNWYGFRDFSRGPHTNLMVHYVDMVHFVTGAKAPKCAVALGGTFRWKNQYSCPDSIEVALEYPEGFLVRYCSVFGNGANSYFKFIGTRGTLDVTGTAPGRVWTVSGEGSGEPDKIQPGTEVPKAESVPHMQNFFECMRTRKSPIAPLEAGYAHAVAIILADEAFTRGARMVYDPVKRTIQAG